MASALLIRQYVEKFWHYKLQSFEKFFWFNDMVLIL